MIVTNRRLSRFAFLLAVVLCVAETSETAAECEHGFLPRCSDALSESMVVLDGNAKAESPPRDLDEEAPADESLVNEIVANTGASQEAIDLRWNDMDNLCLRAFFFNGDCKDEMKNCDGVTNSISYVPSMNSFGLTGYGEAAHFTQSSLGIDCGADKDIENLQMFSISAWVYVEDHSDTPYGRIVEKFPGGWRLRIHATIDGKVVFVGEVFCGETSAISYSGRHYSVDLWHHVVMTYDHSGDRMVHIYVNGKEAAYSPNPVLGEGARSDDSAAKMVIGNNETGDRVFRGHIDDLRLYKRELSQEEIALLSHEDVVKSSRPIVSFTFDDAHETVYTNAKPVFDRQGEIATVYMATLNLGREGDLNAEQLQALQAVGWEIGSHSKNHPLMTTLTDEQIEQECQGSKAELEKLGLRINNFAYPSGDHDCRVRRICRAHYRSARATFRWPGPLISNRYRTYSITGVPGDDTTLATLQGWIDEAEANDHWLVLFFHHIEPEKAQKIDSLIEYIHGKGIAIMTVDQALDCMEHSLRTWTDRAHDLYQGSAIRLENRSAVPQQYCQTRTLGEGECVVSFLVYTDGSDVSSEDAVPSAATESENAIEEFHYEPREGGINLCWGVFTAATGEWKLGVQMRERKTAYVSLITCYRLVGPAIASIMKDTGIPNDGITLRWHGSRGAEYEVLFSETPSHAHPGLSLGSSRLMGRGEWLSWSDFGAASRPAPLDPTVRQRYYWVKLCPTAWPAD